MRQPGQGLPQARIGAELHHHVLSNALDEFFAE
jgi:hypothetical protein